MSSLPPSERPRPIETDPGRDEGQVVPPGWLDHAPVTRALLALNVAVFVVEVALGGRSALTHLGDRAALAFGASYSLAVFGDHRLETLLTACFLHDGLLHIGCNMLALWQVGPLVERAAGSARMAPMYLLAGVSGNALSAASRWFSLSAATTVGASGAICGVAAAALVVGWRVQGWRGPLTQAMFQWLAFLVVLGLFAPSVGLNIDNAAHLGGVLAGALIALSWRRGYRYSERATAAALWACSATVVLCIALVAVRDRTDPFAIMNLGERAEYTRVALAQERCEDAVQGLQAVERLRARMSPVTSLRAQVEAKCGGEER